MEGFHRAELHVQSSFSTRSSLGILRELNGPEGLISSRFLHEVAKTKGMDHVAIADHYYRGGLRRTKMKCQRCGGIMVPEEFYGPCDVFSGWRCIYCGEIIDPVILQNRRIQTQDNLIVLPTTPL